MGLPVPVAPGYQPRAEVDCYAVAFYIEARKPLTTMYNLEVFNLTREVISI